MGVGSRRNRYGARGDGGGSEGFRAGGGTGDGTEYGERGRHPRHGHARRVDRRPAPGRGAPRRRADGRGQRHRRHASPRAPGRPRVGPPPAPGGEEPSVRPRTPNGSGASCGRSTAPPCRILRPTSLRRPGGARRDLHADGRGRRFHPGSRDSRVAGVDPGAVHDLGMAYVDGLVALSKVDWRARGLDGLGKPDGFLQRQVSRWRPLDGYRVRGSGGGVPLRLAGSQPSRDDPTAIMHGDYSPFNVMVANGPPVRLAAIIDWDTGTIGDQPSTSATCWRGGSSRARSGHSGAGRNSPGHRHAVRWRIATPATPAATSRRSGTTRCSRCSSSARSSKACTPSASRGGDRRAEPDDEPRAAAVRRGCRVRPRRAAMNTRALLE